MAGELEVGLGWLTKCNFALIQLVRLDVVCVEIGVTTARCRLQIFDYSRAVQSLLSKVKYVLGLFNNERIWGHCLTVSQDTPNTQQPN